MNYLYSGDNFGTIKEYKITKVLNPDNLSTDSIIEYSSSGFMKKITYIYVNNSINYNGKVRTNNDMFIGYSDGTINVISIPLNNQSDIPKITFLVNGEVIFIRDITFNYSNESEKGNKVIMTITESKKLYLFRLPQINQEQLYFRSTVDFNTDKESIYKNYSNLIIEILDLPCTSLKCVAYNKIKNSIAFGGYDSDIKMIDLNTMKLTWSSKNIQLNMLKHRVPIDVTKLAFIQEDPEILLCGTGYGEVRLYAPQLQRRPIINYEIWEEKLPVTGLEIIKNWTKLKSNNSYGSVVAIGNNKGSVLLLKISDTQVNIHKRPNFCLENRDSAFKKKKLLPLIREYVQFNISINKLEENKLHNIRSIHKVEISTLGSFKGIMGGITTINSFKLNDKEHSDSIFLAIGGPGRYIYIFEVKKRRLVKKIYTSQKIVFIEFSE
ncbi:WD repeat-containing 74 isoform X1 [Cryptosporidium sp. chipmunk genotype I]|uniref:WD repeat-containing 74 isoform X1 n=1 Tax=Cryptosporidium sp. chipmunk genotype I TaxID=1280935 RepID=UPI00351A89EF|nr:WD repeat-containing 74 isoform X1 [Cryptosporidium sp. chipmunk genotype I]